jgi:lipooligosaccharide transport system permease protein
MGFDLSLRAAAHVWQRNATIYRKTFHLNILPNFFEPFFYLLALGWGLGQHLHNVDGRSYLEFIAPGLVAYNAAMGATFEVTYNTFVKMTFSRTYDSVIAAPVSVEDIVVGEVLWGVTRAVIYAAGFLVIACAMGAIAPGRALLVLLVTPLTGALFASLGMIFTAVVPVIDLYSFYYTLFMTPLFLFSGIFFPMRDLPEFIQGAIVFTPLFHGVRASNELAWGTQGASTVWSLVYLVLVSAGLLALALKMMKRRLVR